MIVTMQASFVASTYEEAVARGTQIWREFIGSKDAELPWDATLRIELGENITENVDGRVLSRQVSGTTTLSARAEVTKK